MAMFFWSSFDLLFILHHNHFVNKFCQQVHYMRIGGTADKYGGHIGSNLPTFI
jgi:hypothetical protein